MKKACDMTADEFEQWLSESLKSLMKIDPIERAQNNRSYGKITRGQFSGHIRASMQRRQTK